MQFRLRAHPRNVILPVSAPIDWSGCEPTSWITIDTTFGGQIGFKLKPDSSIVEGPIREGLQLVKDNPGVCACFRLVLVTYGCVA